MLSRYSRIFFVDSSAGARALDELLQVFPKMQLENMAEDRNMIQVALCGRSPDVKDPFIDEPKKEDPNKDLAANRPQKLVLVWLI